MYASTATRLPIAEWARRMGLHPLHFAGVTLAGLGRTSCAQAWLQYGWQSADMTSRDEVAQAIARAEDMIENHLGYRLLPTWEEDEWRQNAHGFRPDDLRFAGWGVDGRHAEATTRYGHLIAGGVRSTDTLDPAAAIVYSDPDGDGYKELATIIAPATGLVHPEEIHVYAFGHPGIDAYEIRPLRSVSFSSGSVTITVGREQFVLEEITEGYLTSTAVDGLDDDLFADTCAVVRLYNDPQQQATFVWEPTGGCSCGTSGCGSCSYSQQSGCIVPRNQEMGILTYWPAEWVQADLDFSARDWLLARSPDLLRLSYYAGYQDKRRRYPTIQMAERWAAAVTSLSASMLDRPVCSCTSLGPQFAEDLAFRSGATELAAYELSKADLDNPFGTRRGAVMAWRAVRAPDAILNRALPIA